VLSSGEAYAYVGGTISGAMVSAGGYLFASSGGAASAATILGRQNVYSGGIARATVVLSGGRNVVSSGGTASNTVVSSGGLDVVGSGGVASGTMVGAGGLAFVFGSAIGDIISSGGAEYVSSGGTLSGATLSGGFLEIQSGGMAGTSQINFSSAGGTLRLDDSQSFNGVISGFGVPGGIDLRDITFATATLGYSGDTTSGILTVQDGTHTAQIHLLGQYVLANFKKQNDGAGGTLITDPPVVDPSSLVNPHA
jgi:trimeric autotransporter adhesin